MRAPSDPAPVSADDLARRLPVTGYFDRVSARPGERLAVKVSAEGCKEYHSEVVRIVSGDPNPDGPGLVYVSQDFGRGVHPARTQPIDRGSYALMPPDSLAAGPALALSILVQPWLLHDRPATLIAAEAPDGTGWRLEMTDTQVTLHYQGTDAPALSVSQPHALRRKDWARVTAGFDRAEGRLWVAHCAPDAVASAATHETGAPLAALPDTLAPCLAARCRKHISEAHFNGRLEDPSLFSGAAPPPDPRGDRSGRLLAWWDFSAGIDTAGVLDRGPHGLSGRLRNLPTRAVRGLRWDGSVTCWTMAPEHYAAIHFHEDDLSDCRWETDFDLVIPKDQPSGVYGLRLSCDGGEDILPFYVLPPRGTRTAPVCFLASTLTHQAYANHARGNTDAAFRRRMADWGAAPNADDFPVYGGSTYNYHPDGSGISLSSRLRPTLTIRPAYLTFDDPRGSGLRHFPADTHLLCWLERKGFSFDVVTDEDLDDEGAGLLDGYRAVVTGSHPEYHTPRMLDALEGYRADGGNFAYLGGNGFYWRIARSPRMPGILEVRRTEGGIRAWAADAGEGHHQLDGGYGGLWRRNGRPPQRLGGVGFSAQGVFDGAWYRRTGASRDPAHSWIFDGVDEDRLGDYGLSGGGAAGFELDRADPALGTSETTAILARSEGHGDSFVTVPEELLSHLHTLSGEPPDQLIRAEIVHDPGQGGPVPRGALFAVGSITFCGSLLHAGGENGVSRMLENVLRRFCAEG